ncbi:phosphoribosylformylglycinamidine synthase [Treponema pectinovorum]|uniref:phosphoribosylformylglycinamidine synthase n=1 Tax=Treponema pectinovorum TaxID=164 RepID=UPI0011C7D27E|nr:phosphoribosylformylglycinamidine synthase [Treponema pectinovorum]
MFRIYVERKPGFESEAQGILSEINGFLGISSVKGVRYFNRYDIENVSEEIFKASASRIFSEPQSDSILLSEVKAEPSDTVIVWEFLPGQYDQRADSAEQCLVLLRQSLKDSMQVEDLPPRVRCAKMVILSGNVSADEASKIQNYLINPVDSRLASKEIPQTLEIKTEEPGDVPVVEGFTSLGKKELAVFLAKMGLAMDLADLVFLQKYFKSIGRNPTETEIRVLDTYWSDHCRHTTFNTVLKDIKIKKGPYAKLFKKSLENYKAMHTELYAKRKDKPLTLMDMATIGGKYLKKHGFLNDLEVSEENNACSIFVDVRYTTDKDGNPIEKGNEEVERWLLQFKNETHNHPTEIEPFGGAATCIGGAIRDPLSGRSWVYQSMRVTGAGDPTVSMDKTLSGKLPQLKLCREAAQGFSSYGNQIGLTTGQVAEIYHPGFVAKRMELGAVIGASPYSTVMRETPEAGDIIILLGGGTGRDGIGGATGSSKVHTEKSVTTAAAEVQKGNAVEERKIQRLFRNPEVSKMIRRSNDFGAGGVSVAVGELAPGLDINLDSVPKKYEGLNGTELAISESQERMAVVVRSSDVEKFIKFCNLENLNAVVVATVTDKNKLTMKWRGKTIVDLDRSFLDSAGAPHYAKAQIVDPAPVDVSPLVEPLESVKDALGECAYATGESAANVPSKEQIKNAFIANIGDLACCSQRGLQERFDGSIGSSTVLFPFGGKHQGTPECAMSAKIPVLSPRETSTVSLMSYGYDPRVAQWSSWHGAQTAILSSLTKISCAGGKASTSRMSYQEFFGRTVDDKTWGYPAAALLGAVDAQKEMGCASIGGKDSMSGTFKDMNVPHTLVSFAVAHDEAKNVQSGSFKKIGSFIYLVQTPYSSELAPDWQTFKKNSDALYEANKAGKILAMYPVGAGGIAEAITKMAFGNRIGVQLTAIPSSATALGFHRNVNNTIADLFTPLYGSIIVETEDEKFESNGFVNTTVVRIGNTQQDKMISIAMSGLNPLPLTEISLDELYSAWEEKLSKVFPPVSSKKNEELNDWAKSVHPSLQDARSKKDSFTVLNKSKSKPRVIIPVFPGTNCEFDMARAFNLAGADSKIFVFRNRTLQDLEESLNSFENEISQSQILAFSGGFSAGDEPDGSGKFIANVIREKRIADAITAHLENKDGLILGICNGFQALIKTGLLPFGKIVESKEENPTLTYNNIHRHISRVVRTRMVSATSPWALDKTVLDERPHYVPASHGEGRIIMQESLAKSLFEKGQIFSQYCDGNGIPTMNEPDNPNGSAYAIEGLTSPDGRVLGKMGHSERTLGIGGYSEDLIKNIAYDKQANSCQNIFAAGVRYFK